MSDPYGIGIDPDYLCGLIRDMLRTPEELQQNTLNLFASPTTLATLTASRGDRHVHIYLQADDAPELDDHDYEAIRKQALERGCFVTASGVRCILEVAGLWRADQMARLAKRS